MRQAHPDRREAATGPAMEQAIREVTAERSLGDGAGGETRPTPLPTPAPPSSAAGAA